MNRRYNFLDLDDVIASDPKAPAAVLPLPYERTVTYGRGTAAGPAAVLEASTQVELFDEEMLKEPRWRVQTLPAVNFTGLSEEQALARIRETAFTVFAGQRFLLSLGGEHSITPALVQAAREAAGNVDVVWLDAHADLREHYQGTRYSHACAARRVVEDRVNVVWLGLRSLSAAEYEFIRSQKLTAVRAREIVGRSLDHVMPVILDVLSNPVYLSIDIDVLDPALVPGTGTPEPGGLDWYTVVDIVRTLCRERSVIGADIVEVAPLPGSQVTEFVAARLAAKLLLEAVFGT